ncbi:adenylate/guanylate cyclase domain-containing protein [Ruegeria arenilitoris]|uniref:adenylate/guanylate cyclase domain-containing protein n=1 Tax=Ruegeria arenilitoris TaxID=1173585 RepID=UPI00147A98F7|nr:adenylate/guanylate cyclase domain-containing protein [Ruegeria arenilitoris]
MASRDIDLGRSNNIARERTSSGCGLKIRISVLLALTIGGLVALSAGAVLLVSTYANVRNTTELLNTSAAMIVESIQDNVFSLTTPIEELAKSLEEDARSGEVDLSDTEFLKAYFKGVAASAPYLSDLAIVYPDGSLFITTHVTDPGGPSFVATNQPPAAGTLRYLEDVKSYDQLFWNEPFFDQGRTHISATIPAYRDGTFLGAILVSSTVHHFSGLINELGGKYGATGFILYGDSRVLAHPKLLNLTGNGLNADAPLHSVAALDDAVISQMLTQAPEFQGSDGSFDGFVVERPDGEHLVLTSTVHEFGAEPWVIGQYSPLSDWSNQWSRLSDAALVSGGLLLASVIAALLLAKRLAAPIHRSTEEAIKISELHLDQIDYLPPSRVAELNLQAVAFNKMLDGLRWFETYLPRALVRQLLTTDDPNLVQPREVELTVMFADIVGFTPASEAMTPQATADMLNRHFEILNRCIQAEGGTLDKYIGDAAMAFWGAPQEQMDHAERACRTALAIKQSLADAGVAYDVKIAVHTGPLIVGNIGATDRTNYTVIGDTVNTCARIETLAGDLPGDEQTKILISDATAKQIGSSFDLQDCGAFPVKGRSGKVRLFKLTGGPTEALQQDANETT